MSEVASIHVDDEAAGERVDRFLANKLDRPRHQIQKWIADGRVRVNAQPAKASTPLKSDDEVTWEAPSEPADPGIVAEEGELAILYEDVDLAVLDKPAGLAVHPGAGRRHGTLVHFLLHRYPQIAGVGGPGRPGIVHRLDLDTTGVLVVALSERGYRTLSRAFAERQVEKIYLALVYGAPKTTEGTIDLPLGRHPTERKKMAVRQGGRPAITHYRTLASAAGISCLRLVIETGRTHQIRVHLKAVGHPLIGDPTYGEARWRGLPSRRRAVLDRFSRPALHAWKIALHHPTNARELTFEAPIPADLQQLWSDVTGLDWPGSAPSERGNSSPRQG